MDIDRRKLLYGSTTAMLGVGIIGASIPLLGHLKPARDSGYYFTEKVDLSEIAEGEYKRFAFFGYSVIVHHRTEEQIQSVLALEREDPSLPADDDRLFPYKGIKDPRFMILRGHCPRFGCTLIANNGSLPVEVGWFCPCDSFKYDYSGRAFRFGNLHIKIPYGRYISPRVFEFTKEPVNLISIPRDL